MNCGVMIEEGQEICSRRTGGGGLRSIFVSCDVDGGQGWVSPDIGAR
jgi:hypothetical protein